MVRSRRRTERWASSTTRSARWTVPIAIQARIEIQGIGVPAVGLGTWQITGTACVEAVSDALALGYRHIDTARAVLGTTKAPGAGAFRVGDTGLEPVTSALSRRRSPS